MSMPLRVRFSNVVLGHSMQCIVAALNSNSTPLTDGLPTPQRYYAMATILLGITLSVLDASLVDLALPGMVRDLHSNASAAVWIGNAYQLASLVLLLPLAPLGDRIGYKCIYLAGVEIYTLATGLARFSTS